MPTYQCDMCEGEQATWSLGDMLNPQDTKWVGPACLPLLGGMLISQLEPDVLDGVLKTMGYQPTKALRDQRKADEVPEFPVSESIADIVESGPRPPGPVDSEPVRIDDDAAELQSDEGAIVRPDADDPAPY